MSDMDDIFVPASLPPKRGRAHRWIARVTFLVTDEQARLANEGIEPPPITNDQALAIEYGCFDCGQPYTQVSAEPCNVPAGS